MRVLYTATPWFWGAWSMGMCWLAQGWGLSCISANRELIYCYQKQDHVFYYYSLRWRTVKEPSGKWLMQIREISFNINALTHFKHMFKRDKNEI